MDINKKFNEFQWDSRQMNYSGPGLVDLQVNGINGVDFNDTSLTPEKVLEATQYLLSRGVTMFFPTIITNSDERILLCLQTISKALKLYSPVRDSIIGIHLEGPFISPLDGARGAHDSAFIKAPDWELFEKFQDAAEGKIRLVTIAPEWEEARSFIKKCKENNILVSIGHSLANSQQINQSIKAGVTLSTHLGNGIPLMIKRHPNLLWDQLAADELYAMVITDGHHIPDSFIKVVKKAKGEKVILVSDATKFAGMPPGEYQTHIGGAVVLDIDKRLSVKGGKGILAGAAKDLKECVETLVNHQLASLQEAWEMASVRVVNMLGQTFSEFKTDRKDRVEFKFENKEIKIWKVIRDDEVVYKL